MPSIPVGPWRDRRRTSSLGSGWHGADGAVMAKLYLVPLLVTLALLAGAARADAPVTSPPEERTESPGIGGGELALAVWAGAGVGAMAALVAGETLLTVGAGTVIAIYVSHLILEAIVIGGAVYVWPDSEEAVEPARPVLTFKRTTGAAELRLVAAR